MYSEFAHVRSAAESALAKLYSKIVILDLQKSIFFRPAGAVQRGSVCTLPQWEPDPPDSSCSHVSGFRPFQPGNPNRRRIALGAWCAAPTRPRVRRVVVNLSPHRTWSRSRSPANRRTPARHRGCGDSWLPLQRPCIRGLALLTRPRSIRHIPQAERRREIWVGG